MTTSYQMLNPHTLCVSTKREPHNQMAVALKGDWMRYWSELRQTFNFRARQIITENIEAVRNSFESVSPAAISTGLHVQNFRDMESPDEIVDMHAKLLELGGNPPPLDDLNLTRLHKPARISANGVTTP